MMEFLAMGGHGPYVWSAYGAGVVVLVAIGVWPLRGLRRELQRLRMELGEVANAEGDAQK